MFKKAGQLPYQIPAMVNQEEKKMSLMTAVQMKTDIILLNRQTKNNRKTMFTAIIITYKKIRKVNKIKNLHISKKNNSICFQEKRNKRFYQAYF